MGCHTHTESQRERESQSVPRQQRDENHLVTGDLTPQKASIMVASFSVLNVETALSASRAALAIRLW